MNSLVNSQMAGTTESLYIPFGLTLTHGQKETSAKAAQTSTGITLRLTSEQLHGEDKLGLTKRQIVHSKRRKNRGLGPNLLTDQGDNKEGWHP